MTSTQTLPALNPETSFTIEFWPPEHPTSHMRWSGTDVIVMAVDASGAGHARHLVQPRSPGDAAAPAQPPGR